MGAELANRKCLLKGLRMQLTAFRILKYRNIEDSGLVKYHELAKFARAAYLGDFYRRVASRYLVMAEDISRSPQRRGGVVSERTISPAAPKVRVRQRLPR
jgi:hypothetical protein